jgi:hypothetical protein
MGTLMMGVIVSLLQQGIVDPILSVLSSIFANITAWTTRFLQLGVVQNAELVAAGVAGALLTVYIARTALERYILWNEGTADMDGSQLGKGILRVALYGGAGVWLVGHVFQFGAWLGLKLLMGNVAPAVVLVGKLNTSLATEVGLGAGAMLLGLVMVAALLVVLLVIGFQMAVRTADLVFYAVGAPFAALGQLNPDGGVWNSWWRGLVVLSLSQAVQMLGLALFAGAYHIMNYTDNTIGGFAATCFLMIGIAITTIRGPHMLREWAYHSGVGGMGGMVVMGMGRTVGAGLGRVFGGVGM